METLLKFRWIFALLIITVFLVYWNERQVSKGIPADVVKSIVETAVKNAVDLKEAQDKQIIDSLLGVKQQGYEDLEKPIMQGYIDYTKNYSKKKPNETDNEVIEWGKK